MKQEMNSSVEQHIASTKNLLKAAEMFVSGAEDPHTLASTAENFISSAEKHVAGAETLVSSSENYISNLKQATGTAENHLSQVSAFVGAEDTIPESPKGSAS